jgi:hypothetical protein
VFEPWPIIPSAFSLHHVLNWDYNLSNLKRPCFQPCDQHSSCFHHWDLLYCTFVFSPSILEWLKLKMTKIIGWQRGGMVVDFFWGGGGGGRDCGLGALWLGATSSFPRKYHELTFTLCLNYLRLWIYFLVWIYIWPACLLIQTKEEFQYQKKYIEAQFKTVLIQGGMVSLVVFNQASLALPEA